MPSRKSQTDKLPFPKSPMAIRDWSGLIANEVIQSLERNTGTIRFSRRLGKSQIAMDKRSSAVLIKVSPSRLNVIPLHIRSELVGVSGFRLPASCLVAAFQSETTLSFRRSPAMHWRKSSANESRLSHAFEKTAF